VLRYTARTMLLQPGWVANPPKSTGLVCPRVIVRIRSFGIQRDHYLAAALTGITACRASERIITSRAWRSEPASTVADLTTKFEAVTVNLAKRDLYDSEIRARTRRRTQQERCPPYHSAELFAFLQIFCRRMDPCHFLCRISKSGRQENLQRRRRGRDMIQSTSHRWQSIQRTQRCPRDSMYNRSPGGILLLR